MDYYYYYYHYYHCHYYYYYYYYNNRGEAPYSIGTTSTPCLLSPPPFTSGGYR